MEIPKTVSECHQPNPNYLHLYSYIDLMHDTVQEPINQKLMVLVLILHQNQKIADTIFFPNEANGKIYTLLSKLLIYVLTWVYSCKRIRFSCKDSSETP